MVHNAGKCALVVGSSVAVFRVESEAIARRRNSKHMKKDWDCIREGRFGVAGNAGLNGGGISTYVGVEYQQVYSRIQYFISC